MEVKNIISMIIFFDLNDNETLEFNCKFIRKLKSSDSQGRIVVEYNDLQFVVRTPNWLMHNEFLFNEYVKLKVKEFLIKIKLLLYLIQNQIIFILNI